MAIYEGISGVARQVANMYEGVGGVARQIVKGWEGIGGVAREFYSGELVLYDDGTEYTTVTAWNGTTKSSTYLYGKGLCWHFLRFPDLPNISGYTKICFTGYNAKATGSGSHIMIGPTTSGYKFETTSNRFETSSTTIVFNISSYTSSNSTLGSIRFSGAGKYDSEGDWSRSSVSSYVKKIWLE